jgi:hypothetical protein
MATEEREREKRDSRSNALDQLREPLFIAVLLVGTIVIALGIAFLILSLTMDTTPPAPYFASMTDKLLLIGGSVVAIVAGLGLIRRSATIAGWR